MPAGRLAFFEKAISPILAVEEVKTWKTGGIEDGWKDDREREYKGCYSECVVKLEAEHRRQESPDDESV